ncbi:5-(carboxyamino)imidazole ribonucleotide synthase [Bacillus thermophilus]|uniref:N5-carboxyaminoimidazole ribonucleotide synthase n=1 Tax=Siminovitchia thermophila TaxID=1245522 RepID=A0ABS2RDU9_9BACI|nr:5-(carboxyamino)imidazole ribonucleotide synthase [Siminovitchia thermophila]MBM7717043.1 5-(carboxyamino)imidazole ribonucleotide synthase [Siminovitchia thermophila]ONK24579.1 5-(carboxyamino)imidazole ribonucleotide synthase [Bacillus sp. VT-16-64]
MSLFRGFIEPGKTIGIIGGGQLGRMMAMSAKAAGYRIAVVEPTKDSPTGQVADDEIVASYDDRQALEKLAAISDVITYEFENVDYEALKWLTEKTYVPQGAEIIKVTQDRILEKRALTEAGVDVAPFAVIETEEDLNKELRTIGFPSVLKTSRGGYDGKGQYVLRKKEDIASAAELLKSGPCVLESWIPFDKEISMIITKSTTGELECFPIGENVHVNNILHETIVPARISEAVEEQAVLLAEKIAGHLDLVGTLAIEMFLTKDGALYVNELAPRPHNSGHYTIEACNISQFAQHIRAVCGWPLLKPRLLEQAVMINILGQHVEGVVKQIPKQPHWNVHLYGKAEAKVNRKMGHITVLSDDLDDTLAAFENSGIWKK